MFFSLQQLNDGIHWRFTIPRVNLYDLGGLNPACDSLLNIHFELLCCEFLDVPNPDFINNLNAVIPHEHIFVPIASQTLCIQRTSSGIHEYYDVR